MHSPGLLQAAPPSLLEQLKQQTDKRQSRIVRTNYNTQFAQTASELAEFRHAITGLVDQMDDDTLSELFRKTVHLTTYDSYAPLLARLSEKPCKASAIVDLLSPGLPDYVVRSSSTSGGCAKVFPKYNWLAGIRSSDDRSWAVSDPLRRRTTAYIRYLGYSRMDVVDEDNCPVTTIYQASVASVYQRAPTHLCLDPEKDGEKMATFLFDHAAPYAALFIDKWRSLLLVHALFAVGSRSLETMSMSFINTFVDMIRYLDAEYDMVVDCVANGTIPDLDGIAEVRHYLEISISPDPGRAEELRTLGRPSSQPGWCSYVWPNLQSITTCASGSFASAVPLARWYLGPSTKIHSNSYASTEALIGSSYSPYELNQFRPFNSSIIEFLDINERDSIGALLQLWNVELGRRYEIVITTKDGLWRYRLGDVVEICGFDPGSGVPIMQFVERRSIVMRFPSFMVTEEQLRGAMSSLCPNSLVNWTAVIDDRLVPPTIGFFVELANDEVLDLSVATDRVFDELSRLNQKIAVSRARGRLSKPTIRLVRAGTFSDFCQLKLDEGSENVGQIKVPVVLTNATYATWFSNRVVQEL